ncbi:hypothetical protein BG015_000626 [Linnemannia schmuckeri]|uniref:Mitochondria-eating protein C-terminal domain-containing protein n=1 Tax=Linnemannia schmuckeri TaxID=64567 RepID=A0A9P5VE13_9FUNG|nr:hypothetical protein BG015_000626 [Linnemannia schmuckeri]
MNFFKKKNKDDAPPVSPQPHSPTSPSSTGPSSQRGSGGGVQRVSSIHLPPGSGGPIIPPRTKSNAPSPNPGSSNQQFYSQQQLALQPGGGGNRDTDSNSVNSFVMVGQSQQLQSAPFNPNSNNNNNSEMLVSQSLQYSSYQQQQQQQDSHGYDRGGYAGGNNQDGQLHSQGHSDDGGYYGQQSGAGYDNNNSGGGPLRSNPIILPGQSNSPNNSSNGDIPNSGSIGGGSGELLPADVRKLQDEVLNWKKSQQSSQTKVEQLDNTLKLKTQENHDLHASLQQVHHDREMLQELIYKRDKEMEDLRSKYLNDVRQIRATDDDHSTIEQRVRLLQATILQLTKSSAGDRSMNLNQEEALQLVKKKYKFANTQPYILNMFLEKYIMDTLLEDVFYSPFYVGFQPAKEFGDIHKWMIENNFMDQATRFRQQLCFISAKAPAAQTHAAQEAARIAKSFEVRLEQLYNNWNGHAKVLDLVTKAIDLSLTMRSQNAEIMAQQVPLESEFDPTRMVPAHKSKDGGKVKVCVWPCFVDTNGVVVGKAKVFCG